MDWPIHSDQICIPWPVKKTHSGTSKWLLEWKEIHISYDTDLFKKNGTLYFSNKIETINHIDLILSWIYIHPWPHISCKFGNEIQRNKVMTTILVKDTKSDRIEYLWKVTCSEIMEPSIFRIKKNKTTIDLILLGIHIYSMLHASGNLVMIFKISINQQ